MSTPLGGDGRVIVDGVAYPNSWAEGKTYRQVTCAKCVDTGREITDDGSRGPVCDCTRGEAIWDAALSDAIQRTGGEDAAFGTAS